MSQGGRSCRHFESGEQMRDPHAPMLGWHVNAFAVSSGQQTHGRFLLVRQLRVD
jgi:hypothetical protein